MTDASTEIFLLRDDYVRLRQLLGSEDFHDELERAIVLDEETLPMNVVKMNSRCTYIDELTGERREVRLVYPQEAEPQAGAVSVLAPVGIALLGLTVGSTINWRFPDGQFHTLRIEQVDPA
jgi:regulator of nucleoside diphosphate kinase